LQQRRLYPEFGNINLNTTMNHGYYHAGTASLKKRFSRGLSVDMHYTLAHAIDSRTNEINNSDFPLIGRKLEPGESDLDIRHRYMPVISMGCRWVKGARFLNRVGVANAVLGSGHTFGQPGFGNSTFGRVTAARDSRNIQVAMKLLF
jgi:hypothetical protein